MGQHRKFTTWKHQENVLKVLAIKTEVRGWHQRIILVCQAGKAANKDRVLVVHTINLN